MIKPLSRAQISSGRAVFDPDTAEQRAQAGENVILVRDETTPEDFHGIVAARAVLTARGGMTSHAAVVARGMGKCAVVGCKDIVVDLEHRKFTVGQTVIAEGEWLNYAALLVQVDRIVADLSAPLPA